jgi:hypothetical protein
MKYILISLLYCFTVYSQVSDSIVSFSKDSVKLNKQVFFYNKINAPIPYKPNITIAYKSIDLQTISIYNQNTKWNDIYTHSKDSLYYQKSLFINANNYSQKDSFNPNGTSSLVPGLIIGTINSIFKSLF